MHRGAPEDGAAGVRVPVANGGSALASDARAELDPRFPALITWRLLRWMPSLSNPAVCAMWKELVVPREHFHVLDWTLQIDHLHLIAAAASSDAMRRGLTGLASSFARIVLEARARVLRTLSELTVKDRSTMLARMFIARGDVLAVRDGLGFVAHAPVDRARMPLADRVVSLFVADWLNDRVAYRVVHHCGECGEVAIGEEVVHGETCAARDGRHTITMTVTASGSFRRFTFTEPR